MKVRIAEADSTLGRTANDADVAVRLQETLLTLLASLSGIAGFAWGALFLVFDERIPASIPFAYGVLSFATVALMRVVARLSVLLKMQLSILLLAPFALALTLGGYTESGAVVVWSLLAPIGAFLIGGRRGALPWLGGYLALVVALSVLHPVMRSENNLPGAVVLAFFVLNIGVVSTIAFAMLYYFVGENEQVLRLLQLEKDKSERLLLNLLPPDVAAALREQDETIADEYESVSVLFADVVGFTPLSVRIGPRRMVELLNGVFNEFDALAEKYQVEKIRTMGDAYMAVSGAPKRRADHARAIADMALEMLAWLEAHRSPDFEDVEFRIGINSGPVVAGVIGTSKLQYDVWGDTVNTASRMESQGEPGRIQIGPATYEFLRYDFDCSSRGLIDVKGKGHVETWFVEGRRRSRDQPAAPR